MTQKDFEIIKALAYSETPEQIASAEGITIAEVQKIKSAHAKQIAERRDALRKAGYLG